MEQNRVTAAIETILFAMGDSVEIGTIAKALEISEEEVREAVHALEERCNEPQSGLMINWFEDSVQISSRPEYYEYLVKIAKAPKKQVLTDTLMETLSIIAFKQPVTRAEVENSLAQQSSSCVPSGSALSAIFPTLEQTRSRNSGRKRKKKSTEGLIFRENDRKRAEKSISN